MGDASLSLVVGLLILTVSLATPDLEPCTGPPYH
jgi:hypothetical protein